MPRTNMSFELEDEMNKSTVVGVGTSKTNAAMAGVSPSTVKDLFCSVSDSLLETEGFNELNLSSSTKILDDDHNEKQDSSVSSACPVSAKKTVHQNQFWLKELKSKMAAEVIEPCSSRTRAAVFCNEVIEDPSEYDDVRSEIINMLFRRLMVLYAGTGRPGLFT